MIERIEAALTAKRRKYAYRVAWALLSLLGVYGILNGEQIAAWAIMAAALLGMADAHTNPDQEDE